MQTGREFFIHGLNYIYDAEQQLVEAVGELAQDSNQSQLKKAFESHRTPKSRCSACSCALRSWASSRKRPSVTASGASSRRRGHSWKKLIDLAEEMDENK